LPLANVAAEGSDPLGHEASMERYLSHADLRQGDKFCCKEPNARCNDDLAPNFIAAPNRLPAEIRSYESDTRNEHQRGEGILQLFRALRSAVTP
jgi:hypothetical protein